MSGKSPYLSTVFDNYRRRQLRKHQLRMARYLGLSLVPAIAASLALTGMMKALTGGPVRVAVALVAIAVFVLALLATAVIMASAARMFRSGRTIPTLFVTFDEAQEFYNAPPDPEMRQRADDFIRNSRPSGFRANNDKPPFVAHRAQPEDLPVSDQRLRSLLDDLRRIPDPDSTDTDTDNDPGSAFGSGTS